MKLEFTEDDFTGWIIKNRMLFLMNRKVYTQEHVAYLAQVTGFDADMVYRRLSHFDDALARTSIDKRAHAKMQWMETEILERDCLNLDGQWKALDLYDSLGINFEDAA